MSQEEAVSFKSVAARKIMNISDVKGDDRSVQGRVTRTRRAVGADVAHTSKVTVNLRCEPTNSQQIAK